MLDNNETEELPQGASNEAPAVDAGATQVPAPAVAPQQVVQEVVPFGGQNFDSNNYKMKFRGQEVYPRDSAHAQQLMQQGFGYSQSMEEVGKLRKQLDTDRSEMDNTYGKYKEFDEQLRNNPDQYTKFQNYWNGQQDGTQETTNGQSFNRIYDEKLQGFQDQIRTLEEANEDRVLTSNMDKLKSQYPAYDWESDSGDGKLDMRIMQHAHNLKLDENNLHLAFQDYHWQQQQQQATVNGAGQVANKVIAQNKAGIQQGAVATQAPAGATAPNTKGMTHSQISGLVKTDLGLV